MDVEVQVKDLSGPALDWAVAMAEGAKPDRPQDGQVIFADGRRKICGVPGRPQLHDAYYSPSTCWADGGLLIDKYRMNFATIGTGIADAFGTEPVCAVSGIRGQYLVQEGKTHLIAACRTIVRNVCGEIVKVPEELLLGGALE